MTITRRAAVVTPLLAGLAASSVTRPAKGAPSSGSVLRFVPAFDLKGLDPIVSTGLVTLQHGYMIYDTLFAMDSSFKPRPQMVDSFAVSSDGLTYNFRLRPGLQFHDGSSVSATDCIASIKRWAARDVMGRLLQNHIINLTAVDDSQFAIHLKEPFPLLINALAKISSSPCFIMRAREAGTDPFTAITTAIGSGPFRFLPDDLVPGSRIAYAANTAYVPRTEVADGYSGAKRAAVDRVEWQIIPDMVTQVNALRTGEVDMISSPSLDLLPLLREAKGVEVKRFDPLGWLTYIRPNQLFPPFNDVRARQALAYLVDQADYMTAAAGAAENWEPCWSLLASNASRPATMPYGTPNLPRARKLMAAAGYAGEPIVIPDPTDYPALSNLTAVTISQLGLIGVTVKRLALDSASVVALRASKKAPEAGGWHLFHGMSLGIELDNPLTNFPLASPCDGGQFGWFGWPCDDGIEKLRRLWAEAANEEERELIAEQLEQAALQSLPFVPLGRMFSPVAFRQALHGLPIVPVPVLWNTSVA
jgi:peptide/nickel transport system substrate-binding protein